VIQVGNAGRERDTRLDISVLSLKNRSLTGMSFANSLMLEAQRGRPMVEGHLRDVAGGALRAVIDRTYPLSEAAAAHAYIESRQAFGRVVLIP
jgi:NADPH2:quinone reductase